HTSFSRDWSSDVCSSDLSLFNYMLVHSRLTAKEHEKVNQAMVSDARQLRWSGNETFVVAPGVNYYFPLVYLPQSIGLKLGQLLRSEERRVGNERRCTRVL